MAVIGSLYPVFLVFQSVLAFIIAAIIFRKDPNNFLNRFFALMVFLFGNYFLWESLLYFIPVIPLIADLFRDISLTSAIFSAYLFFIASLFIWFGEEGIDRIILLILTVITVVASLLAIWNDKVLPITTAVEFESTPIFGSLLVSGTPLIFILLGFGVFIKLYMESSDESLRQKIRFLLGGTGFVIGAVVYFAVFGIIGSTPGDLANLIGCLLYSIGLILLFAAFRRV